MGQAFDKDGAILGEMYGQTKKEVFDKLMEAHPDAAEIRVRTMAPAGASVEMPRYRCHKEVWALKILGISLDGELGFDMPFSGKLMPREWLDKHNPEVGGYFVVYKDGYESFSPAEAFEDGYTRI